MYQINVMLAFHKFSLSYFFFRIISISYDWEMNILPYPLICVWSFLDIMH